MKKRMILLSASLLPSLAVALPQFDEWSVSGGTVDPCSTSTADSCQVLVEGNGFVQAQISEGGKTYIKSIVTDVDASATDPTTLAFRDENFIRIQFQPQISTAPGMGGSDPGFLGRQVINDDGVTSGLTRFTSDTTIKNGWAKGTGDANVDIAMTITAIDAPGGTATGMFDSAFNFKGNNAADGSQTGSLVDIDQGVSLATPGIAMSATDRQGFAFRSRTGDLLTSSGVWGDTNEDGTADDPFTGVGGLTSVPWGPSAGTGEVVAFWIGQEVTTSGFGSGVSDFAHLQVDNDGTANQTFAYSQGGTGLGAPVTGLGGFSDWASAPESVEFGAQPTL
ncbi:MAG TPA: hypothetical protein ENJ19_09200 [Gammaproteobacteria bacterium]|nr:hypothetical protein [Gammaproteobacteria bacterium]